MAIRALDAPVMQALLYYPGDANGFFWHGRLLLVPSGEDDGRWICGTPDFDVELIDTSDFYIYPLVRDQEIPAEIVRETYFFDHPEPGRIDEMMRIAKGQARILGFGGTPTGEGEGEWRFAGPSSELFGEIVPEEALTDEEFAVVKRDDEGAGFGLVLVDIDGKDIWQFMHQVTADDVENWKLRLATSGRGDVRVLPLELIRKKPFRTEIDAVRQWLREKPAHYSYLGPRAVPEWFDSLTAAGQSLVQHHQDFIKRSGLPEKGGISKEHSVHTEVLRIAMTQDQLQLPQLACFEYIVRRTIMIEIAVSRDSQSPDWEGLDMMLSTTLTDAGAVDVQKFNTWVSGVQKDHAVVMKQGRLLREEQDIARKKKGGAGKAKAGGADA